MNREQLAVCLRQEVDKWASKTVDELRREVATPNAYEIEYEGATVTVELEILESVPDYVHVSIDVDDGTPFRTFVPLSTSFMVFRDGRVEKVRSSGAEGRRGQTG